MPASDPNLTSVIMVVSQARPAQENAIAAILAQTAPIELIIVNNDTAPETDTSLRNRAGEDSRIKLITGHGDIGRGAGNNLGAENAQGGHLLFMHPDAVLPPDAIKKFQAESGKLKSPWVLGVRLVDEKGQEKPESRRRILTPLIGFAQTLELAQWFPKYRLSLTHEELPSQTTEVPAVAGACMCMSARDFARNKGFDEKCLMAIEDMDFCLRLNRINGHCYFTPAVTARQSNVEYSSINLLAFEKKIARSMARYFLENFGHAYPQPVLWLLDILVLARMTLLRLHQQFLEKKRETAEKRKKQR